MKPHALIILTVTLFILSPIVLFASDPDTLIRSGSAWKYLDNGTYPGISWVTPSFSDSAWLSGNAELGYGDNDEATVVSYGPDPANKYITTYFRKMFSVADASVYKTLRLYLKRDDGAIAYINGNEVYRTNMPQGPVTDTTSALISISGGSEQAFILTSLNASVLISGDNEIAVEIHQDNPYSSDISFDLSLIADTDAEVTRTPYLQIATPSSMNICWRTSFPEISKVYFGTSQTLSDSSINFSLSVDHCVELTGLLPNTKYYYAVSSSHEIMDGGDSATYFITPPVTGTSQSVRIWTMGDMGTGDYQQNMVRDAYLNYNGNTYTNIMLWLGDDAYPDGSDEQYTTNIFTGHYENMLRQSVVYSTCGNHELFSTNASTQTGPYYDIFNFPKNAEAGGVASGSEAYYSFNYANIHFVCLESNIDSFGFTNTSNMINWLNADLAANTQQWTIVYFHAPPYSKGYHDSDVELNMTFIRQNIVPVLESYKVDLVLSGHDHDYERTCLLNGHYGLSSTLTSSMKIDSGSGTPPSYYMKSWPSYTGTVYAVVGCAGNLEPVQADWPYPAMSTAFDTIYGSMVIDVNGDTLDAKFLTMNGTIADHFAIFKSLHNGIESIYSGTHINLFPNPVHSELNVDVSQFESSKYKMSIVNAFGQTIKSWEFADSNLKKIDVSSFSSGIYYLTLTSDDRLAVKCFLKE